MKKINLFAIASASLMLLACTDYEGQITDVYKEDVEPGLDQWEQESSDYIASLQGGVNSLPSGGNSGSHDASGCGDLWCGATDTEGRIDASMLPFMEETGGYWYDYNDEFDGGDSKFVWPSDVHENGYGNFFGPMAEVYGGIKGTASVVTGTSVDFPYVGIGFDLVNSKQDPADITDWNGICLQYSSTTSFVVELGLQDEMFVEYNDYKVNVAKATSKSVAELPWAKFKQDTGWGNKVALSDVLSQVANIRLKFQTPGDFHIYSIGRYGTCK